MGSDYRGYSEKEVRLFLAPLAIAIMSNSEEIRKKMDLSSREYDGYLLVDQYESLVNDLYQSHLARNT